MEHIIVAHDFYSAIAGKVLLFDTNFFIDASNHKNIFVPFINELKRNRASLTTIDEVVVDFLLGVTLQLLGDNAFLCTRDIQDFPTSVFNRVGYFNVFGKRTINCYGVYQSKES